MPQPQHLFPAHGLMKVFVFTPAGTVQFFESLSCPDIFAYFVIPGEIGNAVLILGPWTRIIFLVLLPVMIDAMLQHLVSEWLFSAPGGG
ncbi:DoxX family protein [Roseicella aquatilis]|uniref:DoxX family protein n=1 Tax=Roseicella aquatilis TaxID=2527868 RepID=UPI00210392DC|nr:DoxX family protein [Roseicella aquatilis]